MPWCGLPLLPLHRKLKVGERGAENAKKKAHYEHKYPAERPTLPFRGWGLMAAERRDDTAPHAYLDTWEEFYPDGQRVEGIGAVGAVLELIFFALGKFLTALILFPIYTPAVSMESSRSGLLSRLMRI